MKEPRTHFGRELRNFRLSQCMTQAEFAKIWKVPREQVSRYESGSVVPGIILVKRLSEIFNIDAAIWIAEGRREAFKKSFDLPIGSSINSQKNGALKLQPYQLHGGSYGNSY